MKKYMVIIFVLVILLLTKSVDAEEVKYCNLLDMNQVEYNSETDIFYSSQKIRLKAQTSYTMVISCNFFGDLTKDNKFILATNRFGTRFTDLNGETLRMSFSLFPTSDGMLYYSSARPSVDCFVEFTDFLTKGYTIDTLPKSEIILYEGLQKDFQGFRELEYENGFEIVNGEIKIFTNFDNPIKTEDITAQIIAYDNNSGFTSNVTLIEDNYSNKKELGEYTLIYQTVDESNLSTTLKVIVAIVDKTPPEIIGEDIVLWDCYDNCPSIDFFQEKYNVIDNVDGNITNLMINNNILDNYVIGTPGEYQVILEAVDKSNNIKQRIITLKTADITAPKLTLCDITINLSSIGSSIFDDFFEQVINEVSDNSGSYKTDVNAVELIGKIGFAGEFEVNVRAYDSCGNEITKTAKIKVIDDIFPEFYMRTDLIQTTTKDNFSIEQIKEIISDNLHSQGILYDSIDLISCDYLSNENKVGQYTVKYVYNYKGEVNYMVGTINVIEPEGASSYWILLIIIIPVILGGIFVNKKRKNL